MSLTNLLKLKVWKEEDLRTILSVLTDNDYKVWHKREKTGEKTLGIQPEATFVYAEALPKE